MNRLLSSSSNVALALSAPATSVGDCNFVALAIAYDAFNLKDVDRQELEWRPGATLRDYLEGLPADCEWGIFLNGIEVDLEKDGDRALAKMDQIGLLLIPQGGQGSMKKILMAVAAVALIAAGAFIPGLGQALAMSLIMAGVSMGVGLMSMMLLTPKAKKNDSTSTYGIDGPKNSATEGVPYPAGYGEFRIGGNFSDCYTVNVGDDQYLYLRTVLNDGEIDSLVDIEINEQPITNFKDAQWRFGKGTLHDPINDWFPNSVTQVNKGIALVDTSFVVHQTSVAVDKVRFDLVFPMGLQNIGVNTGTKRSESITFQCQYRLLGDTIWKALPIASTAGGLVGSWGNVGNPTVQTGGGLTTTVAVPVFHAMTGGGVPVTATDTSTNQIYQLGTVAALAEESYGYTFDASGDGSLAGSTDVTPMVSRTYSYDLPAGTYSIDAGGVGSVTDFSTGTSSTNTAPVDVTGGTGQVTFTDNRTVAIRKSIESATLPRGTYEVQIRRTAAKDPSDHVMNDVTLSDVSEILNHPVNMAGTANLSLRIKLSDQLNAIPQVTAKCKLSLCRRYDTDGNVIDQVWTNRPAWIALDIMLSEERGALYSPSRIDWPAWVDYAQWCEDNDIQYNGSFAEASNVGDAVRQVLRVGRAQPVPFGTKVSVAVDRPRDVVHAFHAGNIIQDSFQINYLSVSDRSNEYEFTYYDKTDRNKAKTIRYVDPKAVTFNETPRTATVDLQGVDNHAQALAEMWRAIYSNRLIMRTIQFDNWLDSINMTLGECALIQHDMMDWAKSGRLAAGSTNLVLNLDKPVTLDGDSHAIVHFDALKRADTTVYMVAGKSLIVNKPNGADFDALQLASKRVIIGAKDYEVISITNGSTYHTIQLTDVPASSPGDPVQLWDTDVVIETPVSAVTQNADGTSSVTLTTPLPQAPDQYAGWAFGLVSSVRKPYVLNGIQGNGLEKRTLVFVEYQEAVFGPPEIEIPILVTQVTDRNVAQVRSLTVGFDSIVASNTTSVPVTLKWNSGHILNYAGADIFTSTNGGALQSAGSAMNTSNYTVNVAPGDAVAFVVVAFNKRGDRAALTTAPMVKATVTVTFATLAAPTAVVVTDVNFQADAKVSVAWTNPADMTGVNDFEVQYKRAIDSAWTSVGYHGAGPVEIPGLSTGNYQAQVRSSSSTSTSVWVEADFVVAVAPGSLLANFSGMNSRNADPIPDPTLPATGAVEHTLNVDGSANISVEWLWAGDEGTIDGFEIIVDDQHP